MRRLTAFVGLLVAVAACGGGDSGSSPSSPTTPTPPATPTSQNQAPVISSFSFQPSFGIAYLQNFTGSVAATDPNGDALTYLWEFGDGTTSTLTSPSKVYSGAGGTMSVRVTVSDNKGATASSAWKTLTASSSASVVVGCTTGEWSGTVDTLSCAGRVKPMSASLTQSNTVITGSVRLAEGLCSFNPGTAVTDPAEPGTISVSGAVNIRIKVPPYTDVYLRGTMDSSGRRITGGLYGSGHTGTAVVLNKQ